MQFVLGAVFGFLMMSASSRIDVENFTKGIQEAIQHGYDCSEIGKDYEACIEDLEINELVKEYRRGRKF